MRRQRNRLRRDWISRRGALVFSVIISTTAFILMMWLEFGIDRSVGITGVLFAFVTFLFSELQQGPPRSHNVVFIGKSRSQFTRCVLRGLKERLEEQRELRVVELLPGDDIDDLTSWQLKMLRSTQSVGAAALVVIPVVEAPEFWTELAVITRRGTFAVAVDLKPPNRVFSQLEAPRPSFVGSDFEAGGKTLADYFIGSLGADKESLAIVSLGPVGSWPAVERCGKLVFFLANAGYSDRISYVSLDSWDEVAACKKISSTLMGALTKNPKLRFHVFCGNDKILCAVQQSLRECDHANEFQVSLIGYDGATDENGEYIIKHARFAKATVDTVPAELGQESGQLVLDAYRGRAGSPLSKFTNPKLTLI